jgi:hypothetical protein
MSPVTPNAILFSDPEDFRLEALVRLIRLEGDALAGLLQEGSAVQWSASPVPRPRDDTTERAKGGHGDPTPSIVVDDRRLAVRDQVVRSEKVLRDAALALRGVRRGLEISLASWAGEPTSKD